MTDPTFVQTIAPSTTRVRAYFTGDETSDELNASLWSVAISGDASSAVAPKAVWRVDVNIYELVPSLELVPGQAYDVGYFLATNTGQVTYQAPQADPSVAADDPSDPEEEAFGRDVDWVTGSLTADGDAPTISGIACVRHDLTNCLMMDPGELAQAPGDGAGMRRLVNRGAAPSALSVLEARARAQVMRDDRVLRAKATASITSVGQTKVQIDAQTKAVNDSVEVVVRGNR